MTAQRQEANYRRRQGGGDRWKAVCLFSILVLFSAFLLSSAWALGTWLSGAWASPVTSLDVSSVTDDEASSAHRTLALRISEEVSANLRAFEGDLIGFLLRDGVSLTDGEAGRAALKEVAARAQLVTERFPWAESFAVFDGQGIEYGTLEVIETVEAVEAVEARVDSKTGSPVGERRFLNLLRRAESQIAIRSTSQPTSQPTSRATVPSTEQQSPASDSAPPAALAESETEANIEAETGMVARFSGANPRAGVHVLLRLQGEALWATYRTQPEFLGKLVEKLYLPLSESLAPGEADGSLGSRGEPSFRLLGPEGEVLSGIGSGRKGSKLVTELLATKVSAASVPIEVAPGWTLELLMPKPPAPMGTYQNGFFLGLIIGVVVFALLVLVVVFFRRSSANSDGDRDGEALRVASHLGVQPSAGQRVTIGEAVIDFDRYVVLRGGEEHSLTDLEVSLLRLLVESPNQVLQRQHILDEVWGYSADVTSRTVDTFLYRLRQKIEADPKAPQHLQTVRGAGYRLVP